MNFSETLKTGKTWCAFHKKCYYISVHNTIPNKFHKPTRIWRRLVRAHFILWSRRSKEVHWFKDSRVIRVPKVTGIAAWKEREREKKTNTAESSRNKTIVFWRVDQVAGAWAQLLVGERRTVSIVSVVFFSIFFKFRVPSYIAFSSELGERSISISERKILRQKLFSSSIDKFYLMYWLWFKYLRNTVM